MKSKYYIYKPRLYMIEWGAQKRLYSDIQILAEEWNKKSTQIIYCLAKNGMLIVLSVNYM